MAAYTGQRVAPSAARFRQNPTMAELVMPVILALVLGFALGWALKPESEIVPNGMRTTTPFGDARSRTIMPSDSLAPSLPAPPSPRGETEPLTAAPSPNPASPSSSVTEPSAPGAVINP
ncbi:MAG: hypothetical protein K2W95_20405 [Candidatus Obscuribacterales bacterium]|nr:hypothetical protein [Candidatus Obscuribacterales bacterium]